VLAAILELLVRAMAPILSFTAEEVWTYLPHAPETESVFLAGFPMDTPSPWRAKDVADEYERLLEVRAAITKALEDARREGTIKQATEARAVPRPATWLAAAGSHGEMSRCVSPISSSTKAATAQPGAGRARRPHQPGPAPSASAAGSCGPSDRAAHPTLCAAAPGCSLMRDPRWPSRSSWRSSSSSSTASPRSGGAEMTPSRRSTCTVLRAHLRAQSSAAFGLSGAPESSHPFLSVTGIAFVVVGYLRETPAERRWLVVALGGACGWGARQSLLSRFGEVIDFFHLHWREWSWPCSTWPTAIGGRDRAARQLVRRPRKPSRSPRSGAR
jgi:hypothetical protein